MKNIQKIIGVFLLAIIVVLPNIAFAQSGITQEPDFLKDHETYVDRTFTYPDYQVVRFDLGEPISELKAVTMQWDLPLVAVTKSGKEMAFSDDGIYEITGVLKTGKVSELLQQDIKKLTARHVCAKQRKDAVSYLSYGGFGLCAFQTSKGEILVSRYPEGRELKVGYGSQTIVQRPNFVYWIGTDGLLYRAQLFARWFTQIDPVWAIQTAAKEPIYLYDGKTRFLIPNEDVYLSWFSSWNQVTRVTKEELSRIPESPEPATYRKGTLVKFSKLPEVYLLDSYQGVDQLVHVPDEEVAFRLYGVNWQKQIVTVDKSEIKKFVDLKQNLTDVSWAYVYQQ